MKNRIKELRLKHGVTQADLAKHIGVAQNTLSYWENGKYDVDNESLKVIADFFSVSTDYLLGRDPEKTNTDFEKKFDNIFRIEKKKYPLLGDIACGEPLFADEEHESYVLAGSAVDADFCLRAKGDSMTGARIYDGDIVFVKQMPVVNNGDIAAVIIGDEATLKRVYYYPEKRKLVLNAENPRYEPFVYIGEELNEIRILGKAVAFQSILR